MKPNKTRTITAVAVICVLTVACCPPLGVIMKMRHTQRIISISIAALMLVSLCAVCASTSVVAATTSGGTQTSSSQARITDVVGAPPGGLDSAPAVCSWGANRLDVFATGTDGKLWHTWWDGKWNSWESMSAPPGGGITSAPTAVSWGAQRIDVFVRGADGALWHKWYQPGWSDWESLGFPRLSSPSVWINTNTAPAACSWGFGRLDIFVTGSDGQIWQKWWDSSQNGWHDWANLDKPSAGLDGSPGAFSTTSWGYQRVDVFVRGADGALWQLWWNGQWHWSKIDTAGVLLARDPLSMYGIYQYAPALCSWGKDRLDVFFVDTSYHLQQKWFGKQNSVELAHWQPLSPVGGTKSLTASPSAVTWQLSGTTRIDIFTRGDDFALWQQWWTAMPGWSSWHSLGAV